MAERKAEQRKAEQRSAEDGPAPLTSELQPDGSKPDLPDGDLHHDELANTVPDNHGADTQASVHEGVPQPYGWSEDSLTEAGDAETETSGEPLVKPPQVEGEDDDSESGESGDSQRSRSRDFKPEQAKQSAGKPAERGGSKSAGRRH